MLAPFSIRYVVVPVVDGGVSSDQDPLPLPAGLIDALGDQLDLAQVYSPPNFEVYENRAWVPLRSVLTGTGAEASQTAGAASLAQSDLSGAQPIMIGADQLDPATADVPAGTVHVAVPFDRAWTLAAGGTQVDGRPAFGASLAFDVAQAGPVTLAYHTSSAFRAALAAQGLAWLLVAGAASGVRLRRTRTRRRSVTDAPEPVLTFDPFVRLEPDPEPDPGFDDGFDDDPTVVLTLPPDLPDDADDADIEITGEHPVIPVEAEPVEPDPDDEAVQP